MADKTIGELKRATSLDDDSLLIAEQQGEAVSVTGGLFKLFAQETTKGFAESASADAAAAVGAKEAAQSALKGVQDALNNLPAGGTLVINDLTTGGTTAALSAEMGKELKQELSDLDYADVGAAPAGYGEGTKQDGVKGRFFNSGGAVGWYRIATTAGLTLESQAIVSLCHQWSSGGKSDLVCLVSVQGGVQCIKGNGASATNQSLISNMRLVQTGTNNFAIDVYSRSASRNPWQINIVNTGNGAFSLQTPALVASNDTLPDGETLLASMEWLNPPMVVGTEYRTTERWNGKPVYVTLVSFALGAGKKTHNLGVSNVANAFIDVSKSRVSSADPAITSILPIHGWIEEMRTNANNGCEIIVTTTANLTGYTAYICVKYTKTTD